MQTAKNKVVTRKQSRDKESEWLLGKRQARQDEYDDEVLYQQANEELSFEYAQHVFQYVEELEWVKNSVDAQKEAHQDMANTVELQKTYIREFNEWVTKLPSTVGDIKLKFDEFLQQLGPGLEAIKASIKSSFDMVEETEDRIELMTAEGEERMRVCRQAGYTRRAMAGFRAKFSILAGTLKMNSMYTPFAENNRVNLKSVFGQFKNLYYYLIEFIERLKSSKAYICINCWTIIFLRPSQLKAKWVKSANIKLIRDFLTRKDEPSMARQCEDLYQGLEITNEMLEETPILQQVPSICLPGDRDNERTGHDCQGKMKEERKTKTVEKKQKKKTKQIDDTDKHENSMEEETEKPEIYLQSSSNQDGQHTIIRKLISQLKLASVTLKTGQKLLPDEITQIEFALKGNERNMNDSGSHSENKY